jgi:hypothetical protein
MFKTKFNSLHFRILRIATRLNEESRTVLTERCQRATPIEWVRYFTFTRVIKTVLDKEPKPLFDLLSLNYFEDSRKPQVGFFFDTSKTLFGRQSIQNRLMFLTDPWNNKYQRPSNDQIRVIRKKAFFDYYTEKVIVIK